MAAIKPFRHLIVYPVLIGEIQRAWQALDVNPAGSPGARLGA